MFDMIWAQHIEMDYAQNSRKCINNLCSKSRLQNGKEFDLVQVRTRKISGKKPDPENPGKIRI